MAIDRAIVDISAYVPRWVDGVLRDAEFDEHIHSAERRQVAVLFLDIAGFSAITEKLALLGARGAEELTDLLNDCFAIFTDVIDSLGGDIVAFAGDGMLAVWDDTDNARACHLAARAGLALQVAMKEFARTSGGAIGQRISIDCGEVQRCKVGGYADRWCYVVVGAPIQRAGEAYRKARVGEVFLCEGAWRQIASHCEASPADGGYRLNGLKFLPTPEPVPVMRDALGPEALRLIPTVVLDRVGLAERGWLGEFRNVTILYINLLDVTFQEDLLGALQHSVFEIQRIADRLEGAIYSLLMDDKGVGIVLAFGLPPLGHEDDPLRAIQAALTIREAFERAAIRTSMGISSGRLFCGDYGGPTRRDYCVVGPAINTAARLMEAAGGEVLCDTVTARLVDQRVTFSVLPALHLKGQSAPMAAFRPVALIAGFKPRPSNIIIGRAEERQTLRNMTDRLAQGCGGVVVIEGEPGIGKSRLLSDFADYLKARDIRVLQGFATAIDKSTPYFAWRDILARALGDDAAPGMSPGHRARELLSEDPALVAWLPLLADIVQMDLPHTPLTRQITGSARAGSIEEMVVALLLRKANEAPLVLILEDLHWFDGASRHLLAALAQRAPQILIVASNRPFDPGALSESSLAELGPIVKIELDALPRSAVGELIGRKLGASDFPAELVDYVHRHAGGNPFYCEELVLALRDTGSIAVERGACSLVRDLSLSADAELSPSLEGAIVSRVDALPAESQLLLKVASAIGGPFTPGILSHVYPTTISPEEVGTALARLVELDILRFQLREPFPTYIFRHAISQEVTYNLLSFAQRRKLHRSIATTLERINAERLEPVYGQLAQHWQAAGDDDRAIVYMELAAEQALRHYANMDAMQYIEQAQHCAERSAATIDDARHARWHVILGDACNELADFEAAPQHYDRALALLAKRVPSRHPRRLLSVAGNVVLQARLRLLRTTPPELTAGQFQRVQQIAHVRERLSEQHFFRNESLAVVDETLAALNLAERSGAVGETISGYNALALGLGLSGLPGPARYYNRRALRLAQDRGETPDVARAHIVSAVLGYGLGDWDFTEQNAQRAIALLKQLGDRSRWPAPLTILIFSAFLRGDLPQVDALLADFDETISSQSPNQTRGWHLAATVLAKLMRGETDSTQLQQLGEIAGAKQVRADQLLCLGILASAHLQRDDMWSALEAARRGLDVLRESSVVWGGYVFGVAGVVEVFLANWAGRGGPPRTDEDVVAQALTALRHAARVTRTSPVCRPHVLLLRGRVSLLLRRPARAKRRWAEARMSAERLGMPREVGRALLEIGRAADHGDPARQGLLARAVEIFGALGANADLAEARRVMAT